MNSSDQVGLVKIVTGVSDTPLALESSPATQRDQVSKIHWLTGRRAGTASELVIDRAKVGRTPGSDICLADEGVSRQHAEIFRQGPVFAVTDLGSTNGTFLNGKRISRAALSHNDVLRLGSVVGLVVKGGCVWQPVECQVPVGLGLGGCGPRTDQAALRLRGVAQVTLAT